MMVGSRFSVGADIPTAIPQDLHAEIRAVEAALSDEERHTLRWTLTWLEGQAVVTLDNGTSIGARHTEEDD